MPDIYVGVDNGLSGFLAVISPDSPVRFARTPVSSPPLFWKENEGLDAMSRNDYDPCGMLKLARACRQIADGGKCLAVMEAPIQRNSMGGSQTSFQSRESLSRGNALWSAMFRLVGIQMLQVTPNRWQAGLGLLGKGKDAAVSLAEADGVRLPNATILKSGSVSKTKVSDDAADAYLLAKWLRDKTDVSKWI